MNPQLQALIEEYLADGSAKDFPEAFALAMKTMGYSDYGQQNFTLPIGGGPASPSPQLPAVIDLTTGGDVAGAANASTGAAGVAGAASKAGLANWFSNHIGKGKSLIGGKFDIPNIGKLAKNVRQTNLWEGGPKISTAANTISGLYQGGKALKGIYDNGQLQSDLDSLKNDINSEAAWNPMYASYLSGSDEKLMRQMKNNTLTNGVGDFASGALKGIPKAALAAVLGGLTGGWAGAAIGGIGSLANSGIQGYGQGLTNSQNKLQGLYTKLRQANDEYQNMRRPLGLRNAGLQTRYYNQLY